MCEEKKKSEVKALEQNDKPGKIKKSTTPSNIIEAISDILCLNVPDHVCEYKEFKKYVLQHEDSSYGRFYTNNGCTAFVVMSDDVADRLLDEVEYSIEKRNIMMKSAWESTAITMKKRICGVQKYAFVSKCHPDDTFDKATGRAIAFDKAEKFYKKMRTQFFAVYAKRLEDKIQVATKLIA